MNRDTVLEAIARIAPDVEPELDDLDPTVDLWNELQLDSMDRLSVLGHLAATTRIEIPDREDKIRFLQGLDVLSVPTVYREPKGLYVLEALAAGVPVVQPEHGAFPELLAATGGGVLFPPGQLDELSAAIHELLTDPTAARRLGEAGRRRVVTDFAATVMAERTLEIWRDSLQLAQRGGNR